MVACLTLVCNPLCLYSVPYRSCLAVGIYQMYAAVDASCRGGWQVVGVSYGVVLEGIVATVVRVEADVSQGLPQFSIVGLPDSAVSESRLRIRAAIRNSGLPFPNSRITINLSPASLKKRGAGLDLAIAIAILNATGAIPETNLMGCGFSAELGLSGQLVPVPGIMNLALSLHSRGLNRFFIAADELEHCLPIPGFTWIALPTLAEVAKWLTSPKPKRMVQPVWPNPQAIDETTDISVDMADVEGLETVKRGLLIAACGKHHTLLIGPPGCGKTMLAERFATILPHLSSEEALEVYALYQACGTPRPLTIRPPLRAPHHSLTTAGLIGGGAPPMPGEATLAHQGVLVLDELLEFGRQTLDSLREPLTTRQIRITRSSHTSVFPASFILIGTLNPCLCGQLGSGTCTCLPTEVRRYWSRVSGPFFDRMELVITISKRELSGIHKYAPHQLARNKAETSEDMREKVASGRRALGERLKGLKGIQSDVHRTTSALLESTERRLSLSRRAAASALSVARTISVLEGADTVLPEHLAEALAMRISRPWDMSTP